MNDKKIFNEYCVEVMGHEIKERPHDVDVHALWCGKPAEDESDFEQLLSRLGFYYNPYDDLNQMAEVVEKLLACGGNSISMLSKFPSAGRFDNKGVKQAFRDFITSTIPESES